MTQLQKLRQERRKAFQRVNDLTAMILKLTGSRPYDNVKRVHHNNGCSYGRTRYPRNGSTNWDDVDCTQCWKKREP